MIRDDTAIFFVLSAIVAAAIWVEPRSAVSRGMGAALMTIVGAMALSNAGVIPGDSFAYDFLAGPGVSAGIVLILLSVDVRTVRQAGPRMLGAFGLGAIGTAVGSATSAALLADRIGPDAWKLAGQYTATYTGGGVNYAAVGAALGTEEELFAAGLAADVIVTAAWMATCLIVPVLFARRGEAGASGDPAGPCPQAGLARQLVESRAPLRLGDVSLLAALVLGALWLADGLAAVTAPLPSVLWLTTIALVAAQIPSFRSIRGAPMIGNYLILMFLATSGARSVVGKILSVGPTVVVFAILTVAVHGVVIFGVGRLLKLDLITLAVASQANIGGPSSAIALSSARGYHDRLLPGVAVGLLGYAAGNYLGLALAAVMRGVIGG